ncbi:putative inorganic carbon transporter subunit DabA, partial [Xanthomonas euvesicatoria]|uniref:putative inorganic carbon transporter subunit DabA n=1 Tax=Xanthomonas euvesicatoria TaxID=456327 RepID=UPI0038926762
MAASLKRPQARLARAAIRALRSEAPANAEDAIVDCVARLGLSQDALDGYFHRLLTTLGGWGQLA